MKIVFYCNFLNHHQVVVADELYKQLEGDYVFVATLPRNEKELKGGADYSTRPYCILAGESQEEHDRALNLARTADVCVFGACSQEYAVERARQKDCGLSFEMGERWLKRGWINVLSPTLRQWWMNYRRYYHNKPFYKLCSSAFVAIDDNRLGAYRGRHFKWGYFTGVDCYFYVEASPDVSTTEITPLMWCSRFLSLKHPELAVKMADRLKKDGYRFVLDFYGSGEVEQKTRDMVDKLGLNDIVRFHGAIPNEQVLREMRRHKIFLFTSDRFEGWGAVANEAMSRGCALVGSDSIGSVPYLIEHRRNGMIFKSGDVDSLTNCVKALIDNRSLLEYIRQNAVETMQAIWSPAAAARNLLQLIDDLQNGRSCSIERGPCSKA